MNIGHEGVALWRLSEAKEVKGKPSHRLSHGERVRQVLVGAHLSKGAWLCVTQS